MPRTYKHKTKDRRHRSHKPQSLPTKFKAGFLSELDGRTDLAKCLKGNRDAIVTDLGGQQEMSHIKAGLVERFVFLEAWLQSLEQQMALAMARGDKTAFDGVIGKWIQAVNSLQGLAKMLGIDRKARQMPWINQPNQLPAPTPTRAPILNGDSKGVLSNGDLEDK